MSLGTDRLLRPRGGGGGVQFSKRFHFGESILRINKM